MKLKKLSVAFAVAATTLLMGTSVHAADNVDYLYFNGVNILKAENLATLPAGVTYDSTTNTITMENANIVVDESAYDVIDYEGIIPLNVVIKGTNTISAQPYVLSSGSVSFSADFINSDASYDVANANNSVNVYGGGSVTLNNIEYVVRMSSDLSTVERAIVIDGVNISTNGGGVFAGYCDVMVKNSNVVLNANVQTYSDFGFVVGGNNTNEKFTVTNSKIELINIDDAFHVDSFDLTGEYIYVGSSNLEYGISTDNYFKQSTSYGYYYEKEDFAHILITNANNGMKYRFEIVDASKDPNTSSFGSMVVQTTAVEGSSVAVAVSPWYGYEFSHLLVNGQPVYATSFVMPSQNTTVSAVFKKIEVATTAPVVTVTPGTNTTTVAPEVKKPAKVNLKSVQNQKGKKAKLTWKKVAGANGYQIMYATNKKFTKGKKTTQAGAKATTKVIKKLIKKKTYYVKVRAFVKSSNGNVYGTWSKVKKVKITK